MIKASEVRAKMFATENAIFDAIKNSDEFKYVMQKLEFEITNAANNDKFEIGFNFHAMEDQHGNWQSSDFFAAIVSELEANGYIWSWEEYPPTAPNWNIIIGWYKEINK